jgi:hypothetical protein
LSESRSRIYQQTYNITPQLLGSRTETDKTFIGLRTAKPRTADLLHNHKLRAEAANNNGRPDECHSDQWEAFDLEGSLGIKELIYMGFSSLDPDDHGATAYGVGTGSSSSPTAITGTIEFSVLKNVSALGVSWSLRYFKGPGGMLGANRTDQHKITISFAPVGSLIAAANTKINKAIGITTTAAAPGQVADAVVNATNASVAAQNYSALQSITNSIRNPGQ